MNPSVVLVTGGAGFVGSSTQSSRHSSETALSAIRGGFTFSLFAGVIPASANSLTSGG